MPHHPGSAGMQFLSGPVDPEEMVRSDSGPSPHAGRDLNRLYSDDEVPRGLETKEGSAGFLRLFCPFFQIAEHDIDLRIGPVSGKRNLLSLLIPEPGGIGSGNNLHRVSHQPAPKNPRDLQEEQLRSRPALYFRRDIVSRSSWSGNRPPKEAPPAWEPPV